MSYGLIGLLFFALGFGLAYLATRGIELARIHARLRYQGINHVHNTRAEVRRCSHCRPTNDYGPKYKLVCSRCTPDRACADHDRGKKSTSSPNAPGRVRLDVDMKVVQGQQGGSKR